MALNTILPQTGFLRIGTVLQLIPISRSAWWAGVKSGKYPPAVKLGPNTTAWRAEDIRALIAAFGADDADKVEDRTVAVDREPRHG